MRVCSPSALLDRYSNLDGITPTMLNAVRTFKTGSFTSNPFDPTNCAITIAGGGGDRFDCYTVSSLDINPVTTLPQAGTGFTGLYLIGDNPFGTPFGDIFDGYAVSDPAGTLTLGTGFTGNWISG